MYERRTSYRRNVELGLIFQGQRARTKNVSGAGVLFEASAETSVGAEIEFTMCLSATSEQIHCRGTVVRVEGGPGVAMIATRLEQVWLEGPHGS